MKQQAQATQNPFIATAIAFLLSAPILGSSLAASDPDYNQEGQDAARAAFGQTSKPGTAKGGFNFIISNPDGSKTWDTNLGQGPNATELNPDDLDNYSGNYGNQTGTQLQADSEESEISKEGKENATRGGHAYFGNDPAMIHTENSMSNMEGDFADIFSGCKEIRSTGKAPQSTTSNSCYHVEAPIDNGCTMEHKVRITPIDETPTAVTILVDKSGSMRTNDRIGAARYASLKVAQLLELGYKTEYAVYAFPRMSGDPLPHDNMTNSYPLTKYPETVNTATVQARYSGMNANGSTTPFATTAHEAAREMMLLRPEERKIILVVTDGEPSGEGTCPSGNLCQMSEVIATYPDIDFVAVGVQLDSVKNYFTRYRVIQNNKEMASAMYDLLSTELNAFVAEDYWIPELCVSTALAVEAGDVEGDLTCDTPPDADGCREIDGLYVCEGSGFANDFTSPFTTISEVCGRASLSNVDYCWTDDEGVERCGSDESSDDFQTCEEYVNDTSCGRTQSVCVEDSRATTGLCYLYEETYSCDNNTDDAGYAVATESDDGTGTIQCDNQDVACTDDDCLAIPDEENEDFGMATAMVQMTEEIMLDTGECDWEAGDCEIFAGEQMYCKYKAAWGAEDCCEDTQGGSYAELAAYSYSAYESYAASSAASTALGAFASGVMAAYAIYLAATAVVAIIADCEEDDQIMYNTKRENLKACVANLGTTKHSCSTFGGCKERKTYGCCFSSPLARIIQEQVRAQIGKPWGTVPNLDCSGFSLEEFKRIDWGAIDWSEWIDIMYEQDRIPNNADIDERYDLEPDYDDDRAEAQAETDPNGRMQESHENSWSGANSGSNQGPSTPE